MFGLFFVAAILFISYAVLTQYAQTDPKQAVLKRVWASVVAAGMAVGGMIAALASDFMK